MWIWVSLEITMISCYYVCEIIFALHYLLLVFILKMAFFLMKMYLFQSHQNHFSYFFICCNLMWIQKYFLHLIFFHYKITFGFKFCFQNLSFILNSYLTKPIVLFLSVSIFFYHLIFSFIINSTYSYPFHCTFNNVNPLSFVRFSLFPERRQILICLTLWKII